MSPVDTPPDSNPISINIDSQSSGTSKTSLGKRKASLASLLEGESSKKSPRTTSFDNVSTYSQDEEYPVIIVSRNEYCLLCMLSRYLGTLCSVDPLPLQEGTALLRDLGNCTISQSWW